MYRKNKLINTGSRISMIQEDRSVKLMDKSTYSFLL